jgi:glycosyltransferase involved in cell wall biosynthesis
MSYTLLRSKILLERIFCFPLVVLGKIYGYLFRLKTRPKVIIFSSSADLGGSIRVNADLATCFIDLQPLVVFTKRPKNNGFAGLFQRAGIVTLDLHRSIDNKFYHFLNIFWRGVLAEWFRQAKPLAIVGGECIYFYKVIPYVSNSVRKIEVCHLNTWILYSLAFESEISFRVFSTKKVMRDVIEVYRKSNFGKQQFDKLRFIDNFIEIPPLRKVQHQALQVLFVGRGSPQKRVHLIGEIALLCKQVNACIEFSFVGDVAAYLPSSLLPSVNLYGNVSDSTKMEEIYQSADVLILTSAFEGLPLVVMEMMARGKVVLSTAVDGIPDYIDHLKNGLLMYAILEDEIINEGVSLLRLLEVDKGMLTSLGFQARLFAEQNFSKDNFMSFYRDLVLGGN